MKRISVLGVCVTAMLVAPAASADGDTGWYRLSQYIQAGQQAQILLSGRDHNCTTAVSDLYRIDQSAANFEPVTKVLHSAFLAGREVNLTYTCSSGGNAYIATVRMR